MPVAVLVHLRHFYRDHHHHHHHHHHRYCSLYLCNDQKIWITTKIHIFTKGFKHIKCGRFLRDHAGFHEHNEPRVVLYKLWHDLINSHKVTKHACTFSCLPLATQCTTYTMTLQLWTNNKTNKSYKQLIYIYINISCKCDTNRAGHLTLDAYASRPVACWYLYAPFRLNELSMNLALQPLASQTPTKISQSRSICLVCLLCFVKFNHIINIIDFYNYITDICKSFRYTSNLITDILNKKLRIFLDNYKYLSN